MKTNRIKWNKQMEHILFYMDTCELENIFSLRKPPVIEAVPSYKAVDDSADLDNFKGDLNAIDTILDIPSEDDTYVAPADLNATSESPLEIASIQVEDFQEIPPMDSCLFTTKEPSGILDSDYNFICSRPSGGNLIECHIIF